MRKERRKIMTPARILFFMVAMAVMLSALRLSDAKAPITEEREFRAETVSENGEKLEKNCEIIQTMGFSRCSHSVTRRIPIPDLLLGADFSAVQKHYDLWQISAFGKMQVTMEREIPLFCPMHYVITVNEAGQVVLTHNQYGDGMAVIKGYDCYFSQFGTEDQDALLLGLAFDSREEAEDWLAAH